MLLPILVLVALLVVPLWISTQVMIRGYERESLALRVVGFLLAPVLFILLWLVAAGIATRAMAVAYEGVAYLSFGVIALGTIAEIAFALIASTFAEKHRPRRTVDAGEE